MDGIKNGVPSRDTPQWVGFFYAKRIERYPQAVFLLTHRVFVDDYGIAHAPDGVDLSSKWRVLEHLYGPSYTCTSRF